MMIDRTLIQKCRIRGLILLLGLFLTACAADPGRDITIYGGDRGSSSSGGSSKAPQYGTHTVTKGETLYSISRVYGVDIQTIVKRNKLRPPYKLSNGQKLIIPAGGFYVVKKGDSVWKIAKSQNVSASSIVRANNLAEPYTIYVGQRLAIPRSGIPKQVETKKDQPKSAVIVPETPAAKVTQTSGGWPRPTAKPSEPRITSRTASHNQIPQPKPRSSSKFLMPVRGRVISSYGPKAKGLFNDGINIAAPRGTSVKAAENGVVAYTGNQQGGFGNLILVKHADGYISAYAHTGDMLVKRGDKVRRGQVIAKVGSTGSVERPQLHFQIRKGRQTLNPMKFLS
ncbi:peptidoglycan DD-metalloendopeptidase family protein [Curvivirga aplysinae]|uniref:peptidoglycan DD-metalloendopeptidase family protein n=1 Tax=Curvivirga aplysinae TaxID=2529852 RepID=UPI0012BC0966|nr:M23 family metallopeptidase [Curvivirga aplysinae]MTI10708.1 M23 family metallopeptidase [Curvivirga aplysinae]